MYKKSYTMREMKDIVKYVVHNNAYAETKGRQFWQKCASSKKTNRTWQSLKETFLKRILTDIANPYYELTQEQIDCFRSGSSVNRRLLNKLEWHNSDSEAGPSNEMENHSSVNDEKKQNPDDKVAVPTLQQGEKDLKLVTSKKYRMNQSSKASPNNSIRNKLSVLSSWDSDSSSSASDTKMEHVSHRLRNYQHIAQPTEIKSHIKNGMLMAICGNQMYPVMKQVGSKRHYVKWKDDGTNEIIIAKKCKESNNRYSTKRGEHETNNYHINLSTSSECDSDGNSFHKMPRYTTEKVKPKYRYRRETSSTPNDKWKNEFLLQKKKNDQLMGLLDQLLELKNIKSHLENGQELKDVNPGPSSTPVVQEESVKIDLTHEDQKKADEDNVLKISASYGEKVVQMEVKDDDMTNPLQKVLEVLRSVQKNVTDAVQEKEHAKHENKEVQARVDKLEETIFNTIIELDKHELNDEPKAEERQVENNQTEVDPSLNSCPAINVINEDVNTQGEAAKVASSRRSSKKRRPEDTKTVETQKLKQSPRLRKKETLSVPTRQETEGTATVPTSQESEVSTIIVQTAQEIDVPNAPKTYQTKRRTKRRPGPAESIVEGNVLSKSVSTEEIDVSKEHAIESTQVTLDDSDQEIIFTKESLSKRSSVDSKSPRITRQNRSRQQDTSSEGLKSEDLVNTLRQSQRTRSNDHKEKTHISNSLHYPNRSQNKDMKRKKATHIIQDGLSSIGNARFTSPDSAHGYVDSDSSSILRPSHNKQKCKRKYEVPKKKSIGHNLLPRSIRRSRQSNEFKKQLDMSKLSTHSMQKTMNTSAISTSYHTTPKGKSRVNSNGVLDNVPVIYVNRFSSSKVMEEHDTSITETVVSTDCDINSNFKNTPNSMSQLTPRGQDTPRSIYSELPVSPEISFIEKITVNLNMLNSGSNELSCQSSHLLIKTLDQCHPLLDQDVSVNESKDRESKQDENVDNSRHHEESSLQDSRGYASLVSPSLISGISNVNLSNKLQLSHTLETEFTNLSLEKQQNELCLNSRPSKEKKFTKVKKANGSKSTKEINSTLSKPIEDDQMFDAVGYESNEENTVHNGKGKRIKKQYAKVKIVRPKKKSKNASKICNISNNTKSDNAISQNLSVEEIVTDSQPVIILDNDDSLLTPADPSLQLFLGAEEDNCVNFAMGSEGKFSDILTNDELTMSPVQDTPSKWYLLSDDESLDAHAYRNRSCRGSLFAQSLPSCLSARRDLDLTAITEDSNDTKVCN